MGEASNAKGDDKAPQQRERKKKESILDLTGHLDKSITVKFRGGREVTGLLKGFDGLVNLVLDEATESLQDPQDPFKLSGETRYVGLTVCRGTQIVFISPSDGLEQIANPFLVDDGDE